MSSRRPTDNQVLLLEAVSRGEVRAHGGRAGQVSFYWKDKVATAAIERLLKRDWVQVDGSIHGAASVVGVSLTDTGKGAMEDAQAWAEYDEFVFGTQEGREMLSKVRISRRRLGNHPIAGWGKVADGREVDCSICYRRAKQAHEAGETQQRPNSTVWYTNEGGEPAQRDAERVQRDHILRHKREALGEASRA